MNALRRALVLGDSLVVTRVNAESDAWWAGVRPGMTLVEVEGAPAQTVLARLRAEARKLGAVFAYGSFVTVALNFVILAFIVFLMVRQMNRLIARRAPEPSPQAAPLAEPATTPEEIELLREIRDSLKRFG